MAATAVLAKETRQPCMATLTSTTLYVLPGPASGRAASPGDCCKGQRARRIRSVRRRHHVRPRRPHRVRLRRCRHDGVVVVASAGVGGGRDLVASTRRGRALAITHLIGAACRKVVRQISASLGTRHWSAVHGGRRPLVNFAAIFATLWNYSLSDVSTGASRQVASLDAQASQSSARACAPCRD